MTSVLLNVTFDCADPEAVARFWAAVTGWELHPEAGLAGQPEYSVGEPLAGGARLYFVAGREPKAGKNRLHLDVIPRGRQAEEVARLVGLGGSVAGSQPEGAAWVVMADPEGNEFCVEPGD